VPRVTVVGLHVAIRPGGLTDVARLTVPAKPFKLATVMATFAEEPTAMLTLVGLAEIAKSGGGATLKVTFAEWDREPLVPVTVAVKLPAVEELQERVDVPEPPVMLVEERVHDRLAELLVTERLTVPEKPFRDEMVMMEVPVRPCETVTLVGLADIAKSGMAVM
jgi:hypothetical protein